MQRKDSWPTKHSGTKVCPGSLEGRKAGTDQGPLRDESAPECQGGDNRHQAS